MLRDEKVILGVSGKMERSKRKKAIPYKLRDFHIEIANLRHQIRYLKFSSVRVQPAAHHMRRALLAFQNTLNRNAHM